MKTQEAILLFLALAFMMASCGKKDAVTSNAESDDLAHLIIGTWSDSARDDHIQYFEDGTLLNFGGKGKDPSKWNSVGTGNWKIINERQIKVELFLKIGRPSPLP